ncbi:MAG: Ig-like domain-containing protein, partial [Patescibacteria group bacterium]
MLEDPINQQKTEQIISKTSKDTVFRRLANKIRSTWNNLPKKYKIPITSLGVFLVVGLIAYVVTNGGIKNLIRRSIVPDDNWNKLVIPQRESPFFTLKPKTESFFGVLPREVFILSTKKPVDFDFINQNIVSSTAVNITQKSLTEYEISTQNSVDLGGAVNIRLDVKEKEYDGNNFDRNYGWAFQTQEKFEAVSNIPGDKKANVPVNTGIEIVFNQGGFEEPTRYIEIEPNVKFRLETRQETLSLVPLQPLQPKTAYTVTLKSGLNLQSRNDPISDDFSFS